MEAREWSVLSGGPPSGHVGSFDVFGRGPVADVIGAGGAGLRAAAGHVVGYPTAYQAWHDA